MIVHDDLSTIDEFPTNQEIDNPVGMDEANVMMLVDDNRLVLKPIMECRGAASLQLLDP